MRRGSGIPPELLNSLVDLVRWVVKDTIRADAAPGDDEWIDQTRSPLGRRQHLALVRSGVLSGRKVGKRVLVRRAEVDDYIQRRGVKVRKAQDNRDAIDRELEALGFERKVG